MNARNVFGLLLAIACPLAVAADREPSVESAAAKYFPGVTWRADSIVSGDFSCRGRKEWAILGADATDIVVAVFLNGTRKKPEALRYLAKFRKYADTKLVVEDLDNDPSADLGYSLPGFRRSKTCKGLSLDDDRPDPVHIYWNHDFHQFDDWSF